MGAAVDELPDVREQLIRGAIRLISDEGPSDLSVRRLAQAADRTTMCIYTKFAHRRGLLSAVYERTARTLLDRLDAAAGEGVAALADEYRQAADEAPGLYALLFEQPLSALELPSDVRSELVADVTGRIAGELGYNPDRARGVATLTWATMHGLIVHRRSNLGPESEREWTERYRAGIAAVSQG